MTRVKAVLVSMAVLVTVIAAVSGTIGKAIGLSQGAVLLLDMAGALVLFAAIVRQMRRRRWGTHND